MLPKASQCDRNKEDVDPDSTTAKMTCLAILTEASKVGAFESMYSVINQACPNILSDRTTVKTECLTILTEAPKVGANEPGRKTASGHLLEDKEQGAQKVNYLSMTAGIAHFRKFNVETVCLNHITEASKVESASNTKIVLIPEFMSTQMFDKAH